VLLDHMVVVQQPLAGGTYADTAVCRGVEPGIGVLQDLPVLLQSDQQWRPAWPASGREPLRHGHHLGPFGQVLGAEQLAPNRAGQEILSGIGPEERSEDGKGPAQIERDGGSRCGMGFRLWAPSIRYMGEGESQADSSRSAHRR
jgi:hypothetical protein